MINISFEARGFDQFLELANQVRRANKDKWVCLVGRIGLLEVRLKMFNCYNQIIEIDGRKYPTCCGKESVARWKAELKEAFGLTYEGNEV